MKSLKRLLLNSLWILVTPAWVWPIAMTSQGGDYVMTKDLLGASGPEGLPTANSADYAVAFAWGESAAGNVIGEPTYEIVSGYHGGRFGNSSAFSLLSSKVGRTGVKSFFQNHVQVGVPFDAPVELKFSDPLDATTIVRGIRVVLATDHLGFSSEATVPVVISSDAQNQTVTILPQGAWPGNTLYDVQVTPQLQNIDGVLLDQTYHVNYLTLLDPSQENVVLDPLTAPGLPAAVVNGPFSAMSFQIRASSLSDYSAVLSSRDPMTAPLQIDPKIIQEANAKAQASGGPYRAPLAIQEITAYNLSGVLVSTLSKPAALTIDYGGSGPSAAGGSFIRPETLSLYVLDQNHKLWVKMPASRNSTGTHTVSAQVSQFSVYALMGSADASTLDSYVFPVPWRPHGPNAGPGPGQTGDEAGLTFTSLPPE